MAAHRRPLARPLNALAQLPPLAAVAKRLAGVAPERDLPALAVERFGRDVPVPERPGTLLWPDTFTTYLHPRRVVRPCASSPRPDSRRWCPQAGSAADSPTSPPDNSTGPAE